MPSLHLTWAKLVSSVHWRVQAVEYISGVNVQEWVALAVVVEHLLR